MLICLFLNIILIYVICFLNMVFMILNAASTNKLIIFFTVKFYFFLGMYRAEKFVNFLGRLNLLTYFHNLLIDYHIGWIKFDILVASIAKYLTLCNGSWFLDAIETDYMFANHYGFMLIFVNFGFTFCAS